MHWLYGRNPTLLKQALGATAIVLAMAGQPGSAGAQQVERIAAVVNDKVISIYDLRQRVALLIASAGLPDTPEQRRRIAPQVLRGLIDERLQLQEAERLNIRVNKRDMDQAVSSIEQANNIPADGFERFLSQRGVSADAALAQLRARIAWEKLLGRRVVPSITIGEEEIDTVIDRIKANQSQTRYQVSEIFLPLDDPTQVEAVSDLAERLVGQLREGANFGSVARQFSKSASAAADGNIGWIAEGELSEELNATLSKLGTGEVSDPVATPDGVRILRLAGKRDSDTDTVSNTVVELRQLVLAMPENATHAEVESQTALAREITAATSSCPGFAEIATQMGTPQPVEPAKLKLGDLNPGLRSAVTDLPVGQASQPLRTPAGLQLVMLCSRDGADGPDRDQIRETLVRQRIDMMARRYLRDLRRAAFVDLRV